MKVSLAKARETVAKARESIGTSMRVSLGALIVGAVALLLALLSLTRIRRLARA